MPFFDTKTPQVNLGSLTGLVDRASASPLTAIGNTMSELDAIATQRGKEQYTKGIGEQLSKAGSLEDLMGMDVDPSRMTQSGLDVFKSKGTQLGALDQLRQKQEAMDYKVEQTDIGNKYLQSLSPDILKDTNTFQNAWINAPTQTAKDAVLDFKKTHDTSVTSGKPSKPQFAIDVSNYMQKEASGFELTPQEKIDFKIKKSYIDSEGDVDREIIDKNRASTEKHYGKLFDPDHEISSSDVLDVKAYEKKIGFKPDAKANREIKDNFVVLQAHKEVDEMLSTIGEEELSKGILDRGEGWWDGMLSDKSFSKLDEDTKKKRLLSVMADTKIGSFLAKYIKSISGTAVAEKEYDRLAGVLKGGDDFKNIQTLRQSFSTFGIDLNRDFRNTLSSSYLDNTGTVLDLSRKYKGGVSDYYENRKKETYEVTGKTGNIKYDKYLQQLEANKKGR